MAKARYFYYNDKGEKKGAFSGSEIKALAKVGFIKPDTAIETEDGKQYYAHGIGGIEFVMTDTEEISSDGESSAISLGRDKTPIMAVMAIIFSVFTLPFFVFVCAAILFLMFFVVPQFEAVFINFDTTLPAMTAMVIEVSNFATFYWYVVLPVALVVILSSWLFVKLSANTPGLLLLFPVLLVFCSVIGIFAILFSLIALAMPFMKLVTDLSA